VVPVGGTTQVLEVGTAGSQLLALFQSLSVVLFQTLVVLVTLMTALAEQPLARFVSRKNMNFVLIALMLV
jgi:hypothetical protein